jgi:hypothetical protein
MIKEALTYIVGLSCPVRENIKGIEYSDKPLIAIKEPLAQGLKLSTLTGLVDYVKQNQ